MMMREFDESKLYEIDNELQQFIIRKFLEDWQWDMIHGIMLERGYPDIADKIYKMVDSTDVQEDF